MGTMDDAVNCLSVEVKFSYQGKFLENVWAVRHDAGVITTPTIEGLHAELGSFYGTMMGEFSEDLFLAAIRYRSIITAEMNDYTLPLAIDGGTAGTPSPVNVAVMTLFNTGQIGRSKRGRVYQSGMAASAFSGNTFDPSFVTAVWSDWDSLTDILTGISFTHVVISREQDLETLATPQAYAIVQYQTDIRVHDMGRRLDNA